MSQNSGKATTARGGDRRAAPRAGAKDRRLTPRTESRRALSDLARRLSENPAEPIISPVILGGIVRFAEFVLMLATGAGALFMFAPGNAEAFWLNALLIPAVMVFAILGFETAHLYSVALFRDRMRQAMRVCLIWSLTTLAPALWLKTIGLGTLSGVWLFAWWIIGLLVFTGARTILSVFVRRWTRAGRLARRTVIVGGGENGEKLIHAIQGDAGTDVQLLGVFDDREDSRSTPFVAGLPKLGTVDDLLVFARRTRIDLIIFTIPVTAEARILEMLKKLSVLPVDIRLSAHTNRLQFRPRAYSYIGSVPVIPMQDKPITDWDVVVKAAFDRGVGSLMLLALSPVMIVTAIAIKLDSKGPVLFRQKRYGFNNELIEVFKFRSMYVDKTDPAANKLVTKHDPRVTRIGRFIRKTSIDELPQLFNVVFAGNLSLVGPRPHAVHAKAEERRYDEAVDGYFARHRVKPGITGWAQIHGWRGETDTREKIEKRVEYDLYYIENWSVLLDLYILLKTPVSLFLKAENAY